MCIDIEDCPIYSPRTERFNAEVLRSDVVLSFLSYFFCFCVGFALVGYQRSRMPDETA